MIINECLRIEPPITRGSSLMMSEDMYLGKYHFKAGHVFCVDMYRLHRNKDQWIEPEKFIPERFDPKSPYYLTPSG